MKAGVNWTFLVQSKLIKVRFKHKKRVIEHSSITLFIGITYTNYLAKLAA